MSGGDRAEIELQLSRNFILGEMLARNARKFPEKVCLVEGEARLTYRQFNTRVNRLAHALAGLGVDRGDKVALLLFNCSAMLECYFALAKLGAVAVPVNFRLAGPEIAYIVDNADARLFILDSAFEQTVAGIRDQLPRVEKYIVSPENKLLPDALVYEQVLQVGSGEEPGWLVQDDDLLLIMYTSGTTGKPKGAMLSHKNILGNVLSCTADIPTHFDSRYLCVPPLFHVAALAMAMQNFYLGATVYLMKAFDPAAVVRTIQAERITSIFLVPAMWNFLLQVPELEKYDLSSLEIAITGAAIMPVQLKQRLLQIFPGLQLFDAFGQTEMSPVTTLLKPADTLRKAASVGRPVLNTEIRVVDDNNNDVPVGQVGEIVYRGWGLCQGYYKNPQATAEAMAGGWFHSGDLVRLDEEGFVYVVDRKKDMLITGGENVYPAEVEEVLYRHEKVLEAAVIGIPDAKWGESVHAVIVPKPGVQLTAEEIISFCGQHLAGYKKPRSVEFVDALPRNAAGKVLKTRLREQYGSR